MLEHNCEDCGRDKDLNCYCPQCLDEIKRKAHDDGHQEGYDEGYNKAKEELSTGDE